MRSLSFAILCSNALTSFAFFHGIGINHAANSYFRKSDALSMSYESKIGIHGTNFKFLPSLQPGQDEYFPRILHIAGVYPGITPEDLAAPMGGQTAPQGMWVYDFPDPDGPQLGTVAIPGSSAVHNCYDSVAIISNTQALGMNMGNKPCEALVVADRGDTEFSPSEFFLFKTPDGNVSLGSMEDEEEGFTILARVALCVVPFTDDRRVPTDFLEDD
mmetsp:Transcript_37431/g.38113  ORF Transcript_37431/g.38113 Transcript_37431/m.38113 type:complete len:216 (+) Transcript_37431:162-809(+)|eukprot:CAMPEP_0182421594 /NCGR_PEP_ID=MMETSP1167-20130531/6991_1 /TAXON_ID=2988 /ORGANISM="Mallomonas Sp, Strain CCMP3275" /LENGTH=215 /DNA_ID=CAMNT_0024598847 /DNA_START=157 /DNA_END=804 /DNA_ORIENTATION=-